MSGNKEKLMQFMMMCDKKQIVEALLKVPPERVWRELASELFDKKSNELLEQLNKDTIELQKEKDDLEWLKKHNKLMALHRKYDKFVSLYMDL